MGVAPLMQDKCQPGGPAGVSPLGSPGAGADIRSSGLGSIECTRTHAGRSASMSMVGPVGPLGPGSWGALYGLMSRMRTGFGSFGRFMFRSEPIRSSTDGTVNSELGPGSNPGGEHRQHALWCPFKLSGEPYPRQRWQRGGIVVIFVAKQSQGLTWDFPNGFYANFASIKNVYNFWLIRKYG